MNRSDKNNPSAVDAVVEEIIAELPSKVKLQKIVI
jgi:hypothetical protein